MWMVWYAIAGLLFLVSTGFYLVVVVDAFKKAGAGWGVGSLLCGPVALYYAFAKFEHAKKPLILAGWLGAAVVGGVIMSIDVTPEMDVEGFEDGSLDGDLGEGNDLGGGFDDPL